MNISIFKNSDNSQMMAIDCNEQSTLFAAAKPSFERFYLSVIQMEKWINDKKEPHDKWK